ncbi:MAG: BatD family protein, partial [Candidatus Dependentiae bacterium]|nr:BatD family protein [Candidatus Dependentiae bacterium]
KDSYFMTMDIHKKQAYVGEKITLHIKFYDRIFVDDLHLQFPDFKNLYLVKSKNNIHKSTITIDEQEYSVTEWVFDFYATEPGSLILQDIHAVFFAPELENKFRFGGAFDFFRSLHKTEQYISAQPIKIEILPLPEHAHFHDVSAVGQFSNFVISLNQKSVPVGQGVVLSVELFGEGNLEIMEPTTLRLPEDFKYYDSNTIKIDEKRSYKYCEFIVQANTPGTYHIEPQTFMYFDPVAMQYKKLHSNALDITITPVEQKSQSPHLADALLDQEAEENEQPNQKQLKDFSIIQKGSVHDQSFGMIPLKIYQQLLWLLLWIWLFLIMYESVLQKYIFKHRLWMNFIIFSRAKRACQAARSNKKIQELHPIFVQLFTYLTGVQAGQLYDTTMMQYIIDKGFSAEQIRAWKIFYEQILQASFSSQVQLHQQDLFQQSLEWIQLLKEKA